MKERITVKALPIPKRASERPAESPVALRFLSQTASTASTGRDSRREMISFSIPAMFRRSTSAAVPIRAGITLGRVILKKMRAPDAPRLRAHCLREISIVMQCSPTMTMNSGMFSMRLMAADLRTGSRARSAMKPPAPKRLSKPMPIRTGGKQKPNESRTLSNFLKAGLHPE